MSVYMIITELSYPMGGGEAFLYDFLLFGFPLDKKLKEDQRKIQ